jgi:hypothetical protein
MSVDLSPDVFSGLALDVRAAQGELVQPGMESWCSTLASEYSAIFGPAGEHRPIQ